MEFESSRAWDRVGVADGLALMDGFGRYKVVDEVSRGPFGRVLRAQLEDDPKTVYAIKVESDTSFEKLPGGELRVRAARPTGTIDGFLHSLDGKVKLKRPLSIEDINRIAASGWAGDLDLA